MKAADVLINVTPGETRLAALEGGRLIDLVYARDIWRDRLGDIYLGRVTAISKPLNAAFVDIGAGQPGFLGASDAQIFDPASQKPEPIQRLFNEGDSVAVEVTRAAMDGKGARLTTRLSTRLAPPIDAGTAAAKAPALLRARRDPILRYFLERADAGWRRVVIDDRAELARIRAFGEARLQALPGLLEFHDGPEPLFEAEGAEADIDEICGPVVQLGGGGSLVIEETSALTAIDVNSGGRAVPGDKNRNMMDLNIEAAREAARQIRLRDIGGQILIDFAATKRRRQRDQLLDALRAAADGDAAEVRVIGFTRLGLVELTRRASGPSLTRRLIGTDGRKTAETAFFCLLRDLWRWSRHNPGKAARASVSGEIEDLARGRLKAAFDALAGRVRVEIEVSPGNEDDYRITGEKGA